MQYYAYDVKMVGSCIFGLAFVRGTLFRSCDRWFYRDFTQQTMGLHRLKCGRAFNAFREGISALELV
jgi:hypothetical protein